MVALEHLSTCTRLCCHTEKVWQTFSNSDTHHISIIGLFQILVDIISQSWDIEKAFCAPANILKDSTVLTNKAVKLPSVQAEYKAKYD